MTLTDVMSRPSAARLLLHPFLRNGAQSPPQLMNGGGGGGGVTNMQLLKELKSAKEKLKEMEKKLKRGLPVGKGARKTKSGL